VPEKIIGLPFFLDFFDRYGKRGFPPPATGSGKPLFPTSYAHRSHNPEVKAHIEPTAKKNSRPVGRLFFFWQVTTILIEPKKGGVHRPIWWGAFHFCGVHQSLGGVHFLFLTKNISSEFLFK